MMRLGKYLTLFLVIPIFSGCTSWFGPDEVVVTSTKIIDKRVPIVSHPKPITLTKIKFYVVTEDNYLGFKKEFLAKNGDDVYVAMSVKDYENLALNVAQLDTYISQLRDIVLYYEHSLSPDDINNTKIIP